MQPRRMCLMFALAIAATGGSAPAARGAELALVRVGTLGVISDAGIYVAMEKGYFQDEGIRVEVQRFIQSEFLDKAARPSSRSVAWS